MKPVIDNIEKCENIYKELKVMAHNDFMRIINHSTDTEQKEFYKTVDKYFYGENFRRFQQG